MSSHLDIRHSASERPRDTSLVSIPALLPSIDLGNEGVAVWQAPIQTLAIQNADFDFSHIEPTGVFRGVVKDDATQKRFRRLDAEHFLEALAEVGIEVVHHQMDAARFGIDLFEQMSNEGHEVGLGAAVGDQDRRRPPLGSTATNRLQVPARTYS